MVEKGYTPPIITIAGVKIRKAKDKWDENEVKMDSLNVKGMKALVCALCSDEFNRIYNCEKI